ncbi:MAG: fibrobacter succinogenes major paralogous domain-containing protein [Candidatus Fibromonas sp.]|nr:fibrobacter succinogenes major paralogous domain-containing protein [Candidatus Fibromonas sp.]
MLAVFGCGSSNVDDLPCLLCGELEELASGGGYSNPSAPVSSSSIAPSSSSAVPSSSSLAPSSSSLAGFSGTYGSLVYSGQTYRTVRIGEQVWFADNLNYNASGSKCYGDLDSNCEIYGRLYDWSTAMGFESSCNSNYCSSQIQSKHRGICPSGWHIPSGDDWDVLMDYVGGYSVAGRKLKSTSGWYNNGNGTDQYGFSALPGGDGGSDGSFLNVGDYGNWWSANEREDYSDFAYIRYMLYDRDDAYWSYNYKSNLQSVRCVQD